MASAPQRRPAAAAATATVARPAGPPTLDEQTLNFLAHLHRGGDHAYWWVVRDKKKQSIWWKPGQPASLLNGRHNMYFGVHPCAAIPPKNSKGEPAPPCAVRSQVEYIAAINCLFAEFDAKHFEGSEIASDPK